MGNFCVAMDRPSASMSCMPSAAAMTRRRVVLSIFGRVAPAVGSGVCSVFWRFLRLSWMLGVSLFVIEVMSSIHWARSGCGMGKWNFIG